jgi:hypothetical protein
MSKGFIVLEKCFHLSDMCFAPSCIAVCLTPILADWNNVVLQLNYAILKFRFVQPWPVIYRN